MSERDDGPSSVTFLSVDIVRSKQLKTVYIQRQQSWLPLFRDLFVTFPLILVGKVALRFDEQHSVPEYRVWKTLGEEIVFSTLERDGKARALLLAAFHDAVTQFDERNNAMGGFGVKGCAWNVMLDGQNETIAIPEMAATDGAGYEDVIGPDVDFGFVLSKHGRDGRTIIDAALARLVEAHSAETALGVLAHEHLETPFRVETTAPTFWLAHEA